MARERVSGDRPGLARRAWIPVLAALVLAAGAWLRWRGSGRVPARAEARIGRVAEALVLDRWQAMRLAVELIRTDEGARAFYSANPGLKPRMPSEAAFLAKTRSWRPLLQPLPEAVPDLEAHDLTLARKSDALELGYRMGNGTRIFMRWAGDRLVEIRVY
jgi:hypothetical protein